MQTNFMVAPLETSLLRILNDLWITLVAYISQHQVKQITETKKFFTVPIFENESHFEGSEDVTSDELSLFFFS